MAWAILGGLILALVVAPSAWVRHILARYARPADRYVDEGTGAELAMHLIQRLQLPDVTVESTRLGDHYDPEARAVRLSDANFHGTSLTAITIAAHEVGHAIQHARGERAFHLRYRLARMVQKTERVAGVLMIALPLIGALARVPVFGGGALILTVVGTALLATLVHLVTLPVEFDASFGKALPLLRDGRYLKGNDLFHARRILRAAALTYVAGSLLGLLNFWRLLRLARR